MLPYAAAAVIVGVFYALQNDDGDGEPPPKKVRKKRKKNKKLVTIHEELESVPVKLPSAPSSPAPEILTPSRDSLSDLEVPELKPPADPPLPTIDSASSKS